VLTQVGASADGGLPLLIGASVTVSLGLAPVFGLTTELIVGSAPPDKAGAASAISETGAQQGGALGIAILGSVGVAVYGGELRRELPADLLAETADMLGAAVDVAHRLSPEIAAVVVDVSRVAFVDGMHAVAGMVAIVAVGLAALAFTALRSQTRGPPARTSGPTRPHRIHRIAAGAHGGVRLPRRLSL